MYRYLNILCISAAILFAAGCANKSQPSADSHEGHDHAAHSHEGHEGHDHSTHDHAGHSHAIAPATDDHAGHGHSALNPSQPYDAADEIVFPQKQADMTDFKVEKVSCGAFSEVLRTSGQILSAQGDQACLSAPVSGIVSLGGVKLTEGSVVNQGQTLFYISSKNIASGDAGTKIEAAYMRAKAEFERVGKLLADKIVSQKEYDQARYDYQQAKAEYDAISGAQTGRGTAVSSPISGYVIDMDVHEGDYVEMGSRLANVSRNRRLELRADASQKYYARLKDVRSARFVTPYGDQLLSLDAMNGRLISVGQATAGSGYMIPVIFEFDNPGGIASGSYVEVYLIGNTKENAITLPLTAITEQQGTFFVYVQIDKEGYLRREVKLGASDGSRVEVLGGLQVGEMVVTLGAAHVKMASASGAVPHGHSH